MPGPRRSVLVLLVAVTAALVLPTLAHAQTPEAKVSVAGPATPYLPNAVNEPALAIDANHPNVLAAGANDLVDSAPCNGSSCDLTPDVGISGIYFSLNEGATWVQPTYTGLTAHSGTAQVGPIHTLPVVLRERHELPRRPGAGVRAPARSGRVLLGQRVAAVLRQPGLPDPRAGAVQRRLGGSGVAHRQRRPRPPANDQSAWMTPVIVTRQNAALLSDKEDIWADNAASSPHFGNVYVCNTAFRSANVARPSRSCSRPPATAAPPGGSGSSRAATNNAQTGGRQGCAVRSDSTGVVYVVWEGAADRPERVLPGPLL